MWGHSPFQVPLGRVFDPNCSAQIRPLKEHFQNTKIKSKELFNILKNAFVVAEWLLLLLGSGAGSFPVGDLCCMSYPSLSSLLLLYNKGKRKMAKNILKNVFLLI